MDVNNLHKVVTRERSSGWEWKLRPSSCESNAMTTRLPSQPRGYPLSEIPRRICGTSQVTPEVSEGPNTELSKPATPLADRNIRESASLSSRRRVKLPDESCVAFALVFGGDCGASRRRYDRMSDLYSSPLPRSCAGVKRPSTLNLHMYTVRRTYLSRWA